MLSLPALAAIQWSRFVATRTAPRLTDVPARALFGFAWRYIIFGAILRFPDQLGPWMKLHVPQAAPWMISTTTSLVGLMFLALVSPWAMVLPAIALGDKDKTMVTAARRAKTLGRGYYIGALVILAPLTILSWLLDVVPAAPEGSYFGIVWILAWAAALFLTACAGMSYLTNISLGRPAAAAGSQGA